MRSLVLAIISMYPVAVNSLVVEKAIVYPEEPCRGKAHTIEPNDKCILLPENLRGMINGAKVPVGVVCNFYTDKKCEEPLWIGMEDPGTCSFSELEIGNQAVSVRCYDDAEREEV